MKYLCENTWKCGEEYPKVKAMNHVGMQHVFFLLFEQIVVSYFISGHKLSELLQVWQTCWIVFIEQN